MSRIGRLQSATVRAMALTALSASAVLWTPSAAVATPPSNCSGPKYNVEGYNYLQAGNQVGTRADVWFGSPSGDCFRVSSIAVGNGSGSVELGWKLGWDHSAGNLYSGPGACQDGTYYGTYPNLFLVWVPIGGGYHCEELIGIGGGQYVNMWVHDPESDTIWNANYSGNSTAWTANVNFGVGISLTNGERHNTSDSAYSQFQNLQEKIAGWTTFTSFNDSRLFYDNDPSYHWTFHTQTYTTVDHD